MVKRTAVTVALVGLVMLGVGARQAQAADGGMCYLCRCADVPAPNITKCSDSPLVDFNSQCPACTGDHGITVVDASCNEVPGCRRFISRAPALSHVSLAGLGMLLGVGGIWLTRKRTRAVA